VAQKLQTTKILSLKK